MQINFSGASGSVTGSSHLFTINNKKVLLDCGLYQGKDAKVKGNNTFPFNPGEIDYLILSHAHIDHSGRIPALVKRGFKGRIISNPPTKDLCDIMLLDSAFIQEQDAKYENKKRQRKGQAPIEPIYTTEDATLALTLFETLDYGIKKEIFKGLEIRFSDSGHMLGSSFVELFINEEGKSPIKVVFSGDVGNHNIPLCKEPAVVEEADILLLESTYGNRLHSPQANENDKLIEIINNTVSKGGNVIIPSFAVGRTQEILFILNEYAESNKLHENVKVIVDSPLASKATEVFKKNISYMDEETLEFIKKGDNVFEFKNLEFTETVEDSMMLNNKRGGQVIISASGMADAGRVRHHIKHNVWRPECAICFVGYQAEGTLGKLLQNGEKRVKIMGEDIQVAASIHSFQGLSGHADQKGLIEWVNKFSKKPSSIYLIHGDDDARFTLMEKLKASGYNNVYIPTYGGISVIESIGEIKNNFSEANVNFTEKSDEVQSELHDEEPKKISTINNELKTNLKNAIDTFDFENMSDEEIFSNLKNLIKKR